MQLNFRSRTIMDPDGNFHHNPRYVHRSKVNLKRRDAPYLLAVFIVLAGVAIYLTNSELQFEQRAVRTDAVVVRSEAQTTTSTRNGRHYESTTYKPVYSYQDSSGQTHEIVSMSGSSTPPTIGQHEVILYDPANPRSATINTWANRFGLPLIFGFFGLFCFVLSLVAYFVNPGQYSKITIDGQTWRKDGQGEYVKVE